MYLSTILVVQAQKLSQNLLKAPGAFEKFPDHNSVFYFHDFTSCNKLVKLSMSKAFNKNFLPTLRYISTAKIITIMRKLLTELLQEWNPCPRHCITGNTLSSALRISFSFTPQYCRMKQQIISSLTCVIIALCCHNCVYATTWFRSHPGGWQHFRGESQPSGLQIIIDLPALSFSVARIAGSSLREVMDSTDAISSCFLFSHLSILVIYFLIHFSYQNLLFQARNKQAPPEWDVSTFCGSFVYADLALDCPQHDLDPSKCCQNLSQTMLLVHCHHYPGTLASIQLWF